MIPSEWYLAAGITATFIAELVLLLQSHKLEGKKLANFSATILCLTFFGKDNINREGCFISCF